MAGYDTKHFRPDLNRSMLMPKPGKTRYPTRDLTGRDLSVDPENPYLPVLNGWFDETIPVEGRVRKYAMYVPMSMIPKGPAALIFAPDGVSASGFLKGENWQALADEKGITLIALEAEGAWNKEDISAELDFALAVVDLEFDQRNTVCINESCVYPMGFGGGAYTALALAAVYSATFPAVAAMGDCALDPALLAVLKTLPSDGEKNLPKCKVPIASFIVDTEGRAGETADYFRGLINGEEEGLTNAYGKVWLQKPAPGAFFVNSQPVARCCYGCGTEEHTPAQMNAAMLDFVSGFARWGGNKNNNLRPYRTHEEMGMQRFEAWVGGYKRHWDVYVPTSYEPGQKLPLVVQLHGYSCSLDYLEQTGDWHRLAEERGFILLSPAGYPQGGRMCAIPFPMWKLGMFKDEGEKTPDDIEFIAHAMDDVMARYSVDETRVYCVGHSNGSMMTQEVMRRIPERFAAFCPTGAMGGRSAEDINNMPGDICRPVWFMMGEFDLFSGSMEEGSVNDLTLKLHCAKTGVDMAKGTWYDDGCYHHFVVRDEKGAPMVRYTCLKGHPHVYTAEMALLAWDDFFCHFSRVDGKVVYRG